MARPSRGLPAGGLFAIDLEARCWKIALLETGTAETGSRRWRCPSRSTIAWCMSRTGTRSNAFYRDVLGAELVRRGRRAWPTVSATTQLNLHGPGVHPGRSRGCRSSPATAISASNGTGRSRTRIAHLERCGVAIELGPVERFGAKGSGHQRLFPRSRRLAAGIHLVSGNPEGD